MPTYLYECENCGRFEKFQKITADPLDKCPDCKGDVKRIIGAPGIIFKGSGFYSTDSKDASNSINGKNKKDTESKDENIKKKQKSGDNTVADKEKVS
ncbi:MAG: FmdB family zinc ribbon protein [Halothermotrichaceae bacterium]